MRILDLFCGAGGAAMGYHRAGFEVIGIDIKDQPNYPFEFYKYDALDYLDAWGCDFDAIHASPPCQRYSAMQHIHKNKEKHPNLLPPTRKLLAALDKPFVIENVVGAPLRIDLLLCGTMFELPIRRHRIFESNVPMPLLTIMCKHVDLYSPWRWTKGDQGQKEKLSKAMGIDWFMTRPEVREAIPPAYTEFIGKILINHLKEK